jgi:hypothetical protein
MKQLDLEEFTIAGLSRRIKKKEISPVGQVAYAYEKEARWYKKRPPFLQEKVPGNL